MTSNKLNSYCRVLLKLSSLVTRYLLPVTIIFFGSCALIRHETYPKSANAMASWYGPEFHGKMTASGERFDMYSFTCAHRELSFGTVLKVTNISNNRAVKCIVNDRGPFVPGRDIDLSYASAKEIGLIGPGTGSVRIDYIGRDSSYIKEVRYLSSDGPYTIQTGSFREQDNALHLKSGLDLKYKGVYVIEAFINNATYYRVRVGKFRSREEAQGLARTLAEEGYTSVVMHYDERI